MHAVIYCGIHVLNLSDFSPVYWLNGARSENSERLQQREWPIGWRKPVPAKIIQSNLAISRRTDADVDAALTSK
jgi:hypothetical protein